MRLTEVLVCVVIFLIGITAFPGAFFNARKSSERVASVARNASAVVTKDFLLRKEIQDIRIPYWKNFHKSAESVAERLRYFCAGIDMEITDVRPVCEELHGAEGFQVEWQFNGKTYMTQEYIRRRITDEKK